MITIKLRNDKWRVGIDGEELEFATIEEFKKVVEDLITLKDKFGRLKER
jgi:hypothetical protein